MEVESLLRDAKTARFCSHNKDGTIHATPVWYKYEGGAIVVGTPVNSRKARNVRRDDKVTMLIDVEGPPTRGAIIYGHARLEELETEAMIAEGATIFERCMSKEEAIKYAEGLSKICNWARIAVVPDKIASFDYAKNEVYRKATTR
jgi:nitroimidazol reductase NimA-like FMN-containing flavoprotein (pyridoxamine 5'-phosphate oxidase superfamily)